MKKSAISKCALTVAAIALMFGVSHVSMAEDAKAPAAAPTSTTKGTVTGVVKKDGKVVQGAVVRLTEAPAVAAGGAKKKKNAVADPTPAPAGDAKPEAPAKAKRKAVAEVKTDAEGKFSFADVEPGTYVAIVGDAITKTTGRARITVEAGKTVEANVDLKERAAAGAGAAKGGKKAK